MSRGLALCCLLLAPACSERETFPEGVYSHREGPVSICGLTGSDVPAVAVKVRSSQALAPQPVESDRFDVYLSTSPDLPLFQWLITRPSEPAHPTVSCRHLFVEGGATKMNRHMRCDADRAACDSLFLELKALDERTARAAIGQ